MTIINDIEVDEKIALKLLQRIILEERTNLKTKKYSDSEMVNRIKGLIQAEVKC